MAQLDEPITDAVEVPLTGSSFVLAGPMKLGPRRFIISEIERCGGTVAAATSRTMNYVVISTEASRTWKTTHFGTTIEKAKELIAKGRQLRFVAETALGAAIAAQGGGRTPAPAHRPGRLTMRAAAAPAGAPAPARLRTEFSAAASLDAMAGVHEDGAITA